MEAKLTGDADAGPAAHDLLEREAVECLGTSEAATIYLSAAISLKRIADAMEKGVALTFDDSAHFGSLTNLAWEMGRSFRGGTGQ